MDAAIFYIINVVEETTLCCDWSEARDKDAFLLVDAGQARAGDSMR